MKTLFSFFLSMMVAQVSHASHFECVGSPSDPSVYFQIEVTGYEGSSYSVMNIQRMSLPEGYRFDWNQFKDGELKVAGMGNQGKVQSTLITKSYRYYEKLVQEGPFRFDYVGRVPHFVRVTAVDASKQVLLQSPVGLADHTNGVLTLSSGQLPFIFDGQNVRQLWIRFCGDE